MCACVRDLRELELNLWVPIQWSERGLIHNCITKGRNGIGAVESNFIIPQLSKFVTSTPTGRVLVFRPHGRIVSYKFSSFCMV